MKEDHFLTIILQRKQCPGYALHVQCMCTQNYVNLPGVYVGYGNIVEKI